MALFYPLNNPGGVHLNVFDFTHLSPTPSSVGHSLIISVPAQIRLKPQSRTPLHFRTPSCWTIYLIITVHKLVPMVFYFPRRVESIIGGHTKVHNTDRKASSAYTSIVNWKLKQFTIYYQPGMREMPGDPDLVFKAVGVFIEMLKLQ